MHYTWHHHPRNATEPIRVKLEQKILSFLLPQQRGLKKFLIIQDTLVQNVKFWCLKKCFTEDQSYHQKLCILHFFVAPGFEFQNFLNFEVLQPFLGMKLPYYEDLVRLFYTNVKITPIGHLAIEICRRRIHINQLDWMNIVNLKYDGVKLTPGTIPEEVNFD